MRKLAFVFVLALAAIAAIAAAQQDSTVDESWYLVRVNGAKSGTSHEMVRRSRGEVRTETTTHMKMKRGRDEVSVEEESTFDETEDGKPQRMRYRSAMAQTETVQTGEIKGDVLELTVRSGGTEEKKNLPWKADYLFPAATQRLVKEKGFASGTTYTYKSYLPSFGQIVTTTVKAIGVDHGLAKLDTTIDLMPGIVTTVWVDDEARVHKTSVSMMGMKIETERVDRATALVDESGDLPDILTESFLRPERKLRDPRTTRKATYRITVKDGELKPEALAYDGQTVDKVEGRSITLTVDPVRPGPNTPKRPIDDPKMKSYLQETTILQCADPKIVAAAKEAVGDEMDAYRAAKRIEQWVHRRIAKKNFGVAFAGAKETLDRLEGDCSEHAVLSAALARAAGIPSRIAVGLVAVGDIFGGHMWTEVWVGRWVPIDATVAGELFDATHIKMGDSPAGGLELMGDLVNVLQFIGKMDLEIMEAEEE
ncbi:MAG: transglutaminase domain-containing protein [Planctomycetes bacterium]|nr:transglutaminase domain-containing protein [Planctomycetota bacterium]